MLLATVFFSQLHPAGDILTDISRGGLYSCMNCFSIPSKGCQNPPSLVLFSDVRDHVWCEKEFILQIGFLFEM